MTKKVHCVVGLRKERRKMLIKERTIWTPDNSFLLEYKGRIDAGEILVGNELYTELENLEEDLKDDEYFYDVEKSRIRMDFMENCIRLTKSPYYNKPMVLMLWQKAFIEALYSFKMSKTLFATKKVVDRFKRALLLIARKNTKALDLDTRVPTPDGDRTIRDIQPGDFVFGADGMPTKVIGVSEIFKNRTCYEITFEDGEKIICDEFHKWTVQTKESRSRKRYIPKTNRKSRCTHAIDENANITLQTFEMVDDFKRTRADGKGTEYKYRVPIPKPVFYPEKQLPVHPYILGLWLGDGDKNDNRIAVSKDDLPTLCEEIKRCGVEITSVKLFGGKYEVRFGKIISYHNHDMRTAFRKIGVWKNKHIPKEYLEASIEQRMELLKGLMDTDGTVSKKGQCVFVQKSKIMIDGFSALLSSLGIKHTISFHDDIRCGDKMCCAYNVQFWVDKTMSCFRYKRKHDRLKEHLAPRMAYKSIVNIRKVEPRDTKCLMVENEKGLFLCGERNTVTHNSELCSALGNAEFITGNEGSDIVCSSNDDAQASIVYDAMDTMRQLYDPDDLDTKRNQRFILNKITNTKVFKLSDRTRNKEGRNIDWAILDEAHEMKDNVIAKSIEQSQSLKENPKFIIITTEGFVDDGFLDEELKKGRAIIKGEDDSISAKRFLPWFYTQDSEQEVFTNPKSWVKSNPTLGTIKKYDYLSEQVDIARRSKADRIFVLSKDFNFKQNSVESWLNVEDYNYECKFNAEELRGCKCLGHVDLAETTDLCCAKALIVKGDSNVKYILTQYFIPESKLDEESDDHNAGAKYKEWADKGLITICEGNDLDLTVVADWFFHLHTDFGIDLYKCGYDQRFARDWLKGMETYGWTKEFGDVEMVLQNAQTLNNALRLVERDLKARLIYYNENEVDKWCFKNSCLKINDQRQALCVKTKNENKIDGTVTLISLYEMYRRYRADLKKLNGGA